MHLEEEVDYLLRALPNLLILNGLAVERDAIFSEDEDLSNPDLTTQVEKAKPHIPEEYTDDTSGRLTINKEEFKHYIADSSLGANTVAEMANYSMSEQTTFN